jgi:hypothetical protein
MSRWGASRPRHPKAQALILMAAVLLAVIALALISTFAST